MRALSAGMGKGYVFGPDDRDSGGDDGEHGEGETAHVRPSRLWRTIGRRRRWRSGGRDGQGGQAVSVAVTMDSLTRALRPDQAAVGWGAVAATQAL